MPKRLLICAPKMFLPGSTGGGERYTTEFVQAMRRRSDLKVSVVAGIGYRGLMIMNADSDTFSPLTFRALVSVVAQTDYIHLHHLNSHVADLVLLVNACRSATVVLTDHGGGWRAWGRALGRVRYRGIDGLAAVSQTSVDDLRWPLDWPQVVIYGGGDHLAGLSTPDEGAEKSFDIAFVGRLIPHKGAHLLLEALPPGMRCVIAGAAMDPTYLAHLHQLAEGKDVTFITGPSDAEVAGIYRASRWSVCPTLNSLDGRMVKRPELLGLSAIESLSLGTPVLLSRLPAFVELADLLSMPLFSPNSAASLRLALAQLEGTFQIDSDDQLAMLTWDGVAGQCVEFYEQLSTDSEKRPRRIRR